jgi:hypothetical protein
VFKRAKTVHALDSAASVIGTNIMGWMKKIDIKPGGTYNAYSLEHRVVYINQSASNH